MAVEDRDVTRTPENDISDEMVYDDTETNDVVEAVQYNITSYGADFDMSGLVRRMNDGEIFVPDFQRGFVWSLPQASQFVESLLLGLPVPGIFLTMDPESEKLMVVDGQQRLKSLQYFYAGEFGETQRPFALQGVNPVFEGKKYVDLRSNDRRRLDNSLFHATITRQLYPEDGLSSMFHIFQRLNSTGQRLTPQEIRQAIFRGSLLSGIRQLNENEDWRSIYGRVNIRQKDQELILRFWAMHENSDGYSAPMLAFLNNFAEEHRDPSPEFLQHGQRLFAATIKAFNSALGNGAFRTEGSRQLNAAMFDSLSVGLAHHIESNGTPSSEVIAEVHTAVLSDTDYVTSISRATATEASVRVRMKKALDAFEAV